MQGRKLCAEIIGRSNNLYKWPIKQVSRSNFEDTLMELKSHISTSDFVAVSLQNTGRFSAPWQRVSSFDTSETAYMKAKHAAERFQLLQFAVCPFTFRVSNVTAHPYNFHLFPRDELKIGMPSYSFFCQASNLESMAREGFDFNACINDGLSYLSRAQESAAKVLMGNPIHASDIPKSCATPSVSDTIFTERIRSRVNLWKNALKDIESDEAVVKSLRKLILLKEEFLSRPCLNIDVCSERQVHLIVEMLKEDEDVVALIIPAKGGGIQCVRAVFVNSKDDKNAFHELREIEKERNRKFLGFREVIDLLSASGKPVVSHNSLADFTFIHSKFIAPLPPNIGEFVSLVNAAFPRVFDVSYMMKQIQPLRNVRNVSKAIAYLKSHFFAPINFEASHQGIKNEDESHGHEVVQICHLFAKLCCILKINTGDDTSPCGSNLGSPLDVYASMFHQFPSDPQESPDEDIKMWARNPRTVRCEDLVFLWGFNGDFTAGTLRNMLRESHELFSDCHVRLVEKSCAIVVFCSPGTSRMILEFVNTKSSQIYGPLREMVAEGARATDYETYRRVCRRGLWETNLSNSLDQALAAEADHPPHGPFCSTSMINFFEL